MYPLFFFFGGGGGWGTCQVFRLPLLPMLHQTRLHQGHPLSTLLQGNGVSTMRTTRVPLESLVKHSRWEKSHRRSGGRRRRLQQGGYFGVHGMRASADGGLAGVGREGGGEAGRGGPRVPGEVREAVAGLSIRGKGGALSLRDGLTRVQRGACLCVTAYMLYTMLSSYAYYCSRATLALLQAMYFSPHHMIHEISTTTAKEGKPIRLEYVARGVRFAKPVDGNMSLTRMSTS